MVCNLYFGDSYVMFEPHIPESVTKALTYWHLASEKVGNRRGKLKGETRKLYNIEQRVSRVTQQVAPHLITLPGFAYKIKLLAEAEGFEVNFIDDRSTLPALDIPRALSKLRDYQKPAAYTMLKSYGGILACPTGFGKTHTMAGIIRGYPRTELTARNTPLTVVVTPGVDLAKKNAKALEGILGSERDVGLVCTGIRDFSDDVQVITPESLHNINLDDCGLLMYDEVHTLSSSRADAVMMGTHAIRYGFSATPTGRCDGADLVVEGCFGPVVFGMTYQEAVEVGAVVPIKVLWVPTNMPRGWRQYKTRDGSYRNGLWRNWDFHQLTKDVIDHIPADMQMLAVVDKLSHMDNLLQYAPELMYVHGSERDKDLAKLKPKTLAGIPRKKRDEIYNQVEAGKIMRIVSSGIYRTGVDFPKLSVLLNLAGMQSSIINTQLPGRTGRTSDGKECAFLIDFWHGWDWVVDKHGRNKPGPLLKDCRAREKVYRALGFSQTPVDNLNNLF
jgi:superfamily II DNA or RNA helicase